MDLHVEMYQIFADTGKENSFSDGKEPDRSHGLSAKISCQLVTHLSGTWLPWHVLFKKRGPGNEFYQCEARYFTSAYPSRPRFYKAI